MKLTHLKTLHEPSDAIAAVTSVTFSPNNQKLAVVTADRVVHVYDEAGERRDRFSTKPAVKGAKSYIVTGMAWSPNSGMLAIAQSDNIVFVYNLGVEWGEKKSICNKFPQSQAVTCITWPSEHPQEVVFGTAEGKMKVGQLKTNKALTMYTTGSYTVSTCSSPDGHAVLSGHADGSIYAFYFDEGGRGPVHSKFTQHMCAPVCLGWGSSVIVAGADRRVSFYSVDGNIERTHAPAEDDDSIRAFTSIAVNPSGESVVLGNFDKLLTYTFNARSEDWLPGPVKDIPNLYTATSLAWRADGSRVALGSLCGGVDVFDAALRRVRYQGKFEFTYVSLSQVIVKRLSSGMRIVLRSSFGCEITRINVYQDRFLVANTVETLLLGDLASCNLSEIPWTPTPGEKFHFDNPKVCMVYGAGELTLVEYGRNEPLGSCRTEHMSPHLVSVRVNERPPVEAMVPGGAAATGAGGLDAVDNKKLAYMLDAATIRVMDLATGSPLATVAVEGRVDWLELNGRCNLLLYRDKRLKLHLYNLVQHSRVTLLSSCTYVQWVPGSDVVVAQSRNNLCVWYNIYAPDKVTSYEIKGDIEDIERAEGKTEVIVDEGMNTASYVLDEGMIGFGTAVEDRHYESAMAILEGLEMSPETEAMWQQLSDVALGAGELHVAQRAAAALGDVARARFLQKTSKIAAQAAEKLGGDGQSFWLVRARLAQLRGDLSGAEAIFLEQNKVDEAIHMYEQLLRFDDAIGVAESRGHPNATTMRREYFSYLLASGQEAKAAKLKEGEGDALAAIDLYIKGGFPGKAYGVVASNPNAFQPPVLAAIAGALEKSGLASKAGALYERQGETGRAMEAYVKGHDFRSAVELARSKYPGEVVKLERMWGEWLVSTKQTEAAIHHFLEAGAYDTAISAAISARLFTKAKQLVSETLSDGEAARPFWHQLAVHYSEAGMLDEAEEAWLNAREGPSAVTMYLKASKWDAAHRVASGVMPPEDVTRLFMDHAAKAVAGGDLASGEKLYLLAGQVDAAIKMYSRAKEYDAMVRLVAAHRRPDLKATHLHLARQLAADKDTRGAERHFCDAGEWSKAVAMYKEAGMWDDAGRVAKLHGGPDSAHKVAYEHAVSLGGEAGAKLLHRQGLIEQGIEYYASQSNFEQALALAAKHKPHRVPFVHVKHAMYLEDNGQFAAAEVAFVKGNKPREAIDMYLHAQDFVAARRVAENYDPACIPDVLVAEATVCSGAGDHKRAEALFVDAKKPEMAVQMYLEARNYPEAVRVTKRHLPHRVKEVNDTIARQVEGGGGGHGIATLPAPAQRSAGGGSGAAAAAAGAGGGGGPSHGSKEELLANARMWEESHNWGMAIDTYLSLNAGHEANVDALVAVWDNAVRLASTHERRRYLQVCAEVGRRLAALRRWAAAGDLLRDAEQWKDAINAYIEAEAWDKARGIARSAAPMFKDRVESAYKASLRQGGDGEGMVATGNVDEALGMLASSGKWERVFELAADKGPVVLAKYAFPYAERALSEGSREELLRLTSTYGLPGIPSQLSLYRRLVRTVFQGPASNAASDEVLEQARTVMYGVVSELRRNAETPRAVMTEAEALLMAVHYAGMRAKARRIGLPELAAQLSIALLRFIGIVPCDRAFHEAGIDARAVRWQAVAFVMLNRYVDLADLLAEAAEEAGPGGEPRPDFAELDNSDFHGTEVPAPGSFPVPSTQWLGGSAREEVRDWVLAISMDQAVAQELPKGSVPLLAQSSQPKCIVTGYPVPPDRLVKCPSCGSNAIKSAWNAVVLKTKECPWCSAAASPAY